MTYFVGPHFSQLTNLLKQIDNMKNLQKRVASQDARIDEVVKQWDGVIEYLQDFASRWDEITQQWHVMSERLAQIEDKLMLRPLTHREITIRDWLLDQLKDGPVPANRLKKQAHMELGCSDNQIYDAGRVIRATQISDGFSNPRLWVLESWLEEHDIEQWKRDRDGDSMVT